VIESDQAALFATDAATDEALRQDVWARHQQLARRVDAINARAAAEIAPLVEEMLRLFQQWENITARLQGREPRDVSTLREEP
jgi:hypothetical protein